MDRYQRACKSGRPQLVTLVGAAGIGKSRLLAELGQRVAGEPEPPGAGSAAIVSMNSHRFSRAAVADSSVSSALSRMLAPSATSV